MGCMQISIGLWAFSTRSSGLAEPFFLEDTELISLNAN
jgi:hypothetical protein